MGDDDKKPSSYEIEEAVLAIRHSAVIKMERLQAILDGAILAAEQVQDKRLEILEKSPEVEVSDILIDAFIVFCLESTVAGIVLTKATRMIIGPILRSNTIWQSIPLHVKRQEMAALFAELRRNPIYSKQALLVTVKEWKPEFLRFRRYLAKLSRGSQEINMVGAAKAAWEASKHETKPPILDEATDSPAVSVLEAAQEYSSQQRIALSFEANTFEFLLRTGELYSEEIKQFVEAVHPGEIEEDIKAIRDTYKMLFEAVIWARLFEFHKRKMRESILLGLLTADPREGIEGIKNTALVNYWKRRFGKLIETWSQSNPAYFRFWNKRPVQSFEHLDSPGTQVEYLLLFFKYFAEQLPNFQDGMKIGYREHKI